MTRPPAIPPSTRPLLGLRQVPGRLALALFRLPLRAYRHGAGWLFGHTFLAFTHLGRTSALPHQAVAMVLRYDPASQEAVICAAWGPKTDWYRNLRKRPATEVRIGRTAYPPEQRFLDTAEAFEVAVQFRREHPHRLRLISTLLGWGNLSTDDRLRAFLGSHPFVAFRPAGGQPGGTARR